MAVSVPDNLEKALSPGWLAAGLRCREPRWECAVYVWGGARVQGGFCQVTGDDLIAATLAPTECRNNERELLHHYLTCLAWNGVSAPPVEHARPLLVDGMARGLFLFAVIAKTEPDIAALRKRLGTAVADHWAKGRP